MCWQRACRQVKHYDITRFPIHLWKSFSSLRRQQKKKTKSRPEVRGGIFGEFALSNVEGDVTSISYSYSYNLRANKPTEPRMRTWSLQPVPPIMSMSLHVLTNPPFHMREFSGGGKYFPPAPCSLAYHFVANLKIVDMQARQATSRGVNRGHTWVGPTNLVYPFTLRVTGIINIKKIKSNTKDPFELFEISVKLLDLY